MLTFNSKNHHYELDGRPISGVTTILNVLGKEALIGWAANCAIDYVQEHKIEETENTLLVTQATLEEARTAYAKKRDKAGDIGKEVHELCEKYAKEGIYLTQGDAQKDKMVSNFISWVTESKARFIASELQVYSRDYWYAGTLDMIVEIEGKKYLGDIKTGSGIYPSMFFQTAAYQIAYEEMNPQEKIDGSVIVNIKKDGTMDVKYSHDYEEDKKGFLACLAIHRRLQTLEKHLE